jgi:hypothetical protein
MERREAAREVGLGTAGQGSIAHGRERGWRHESECFDGIVRLAGSAGSSRVA